MGKIKENQYEYPSLQQKIASEIGIAESTARDLVHLYMIRQKGKELEQRLKLQVSEQIMNDFDQQMGRSDIQQDVQRFIVMEQEEKVNSPLSYPKYFNVREVASYKGITPQQVRRNCISGKFKAEQVAGEHSSWRILAEQFKDESGFADFIAERNGKFQAQSAAAQTAVELWESSIVESDQGQTYE
ncbi:hypothetical protein [Paenibacillus sp. WLX2291]|uniref:hypothetical protein n=1 Tax=Paenibacillus sp. WLX2291 TaxID=3296934 RepID=UPI003983E940